MIHARKLLVIVFTLCQYHLYAAETSHWLHVGNGPEYQSVRGARYEVEPVYQFQVNNWKVGTGFLLGLGDSTLTAYHLEAGYKNLFTDNFDVTLFFLNRHLHSLDVSENSIFPYVSWHSRYFEADVGVNFRFTNFGPDGHDIIFYYQNDLFQPMIAYRVAGYLYWEKIKLRLGLELKNFEIHDVKNLLSPGIYLDAKWTLSQHWTGFFNFGVSSSGLTGLSIIYNRLRCSFGMEYFYESKTNN